VKTKIFTRELFLFRGVFVRFTTMFSLTFSVLHLVAWMQFFFVKRVVCLGPLQSKKAPPQRRAEPMDRTSEDSPTQGHNWHGEIVQKRGLGDSGDENSM